MTAASQHEKRERLYLIYVLIKWAEEQRKDPQHRHLLTLPKIGWEKHKDKDAHQLTRAQKEVGLLTFN